MAMGSISCIKSTISAFSLLARRNIANEVQVHAPCEGNYQIVEQARKTLQQILDRILSDGPSMSQQEKEQRMAALPSPNDSNMMGLSDAESQWDLSWLDNADFDADFWMNLPDHPLLS